MKRMVKVSPRSVDALDRSAETRSASTVARVRGAIFSLLDKKMPVTLATIHRETQLLDPAAKPVATSTILRNPETTVLYHAHATERPRSRIVIADRALVKMLRHTKRDLACALNDAHEQLIDRDEQLAELAAANLGLRQNQDQH